MARSKTNADAPDVRGATEPATEPMTTAAPAPTNMSGKSAKSIHEGHRRRLRERLLEGGVDALAPHELLELLLGYAMPRVDVNPLAHRLIDRFGSLSGVMEASVEELTAEPGVGEYTACLVRLIPIISRMCAIDQAAKSATYDTIGKLVAFLRPRFMNLMSERVYLILLDNGMRMIDCCLLSEGTINSSAVTVRRIAELCLYTHASCAVLAHNHPKGIAIPSAADIEITQQIESALDVLGVPLLEHLIITEHSDAPILRPRRGMSRLSPVTGQVDAGFYRKFYGDTDDTKEDA